MLNKTIVNSGSLSELALLLSLALETLGNKYENANKDCTKKSHFWFWTLVFTSFYGSSRAFIFSALNFVSRKRVNFSSRS